MEGETTPQTESATSKVLIPASIIVAGALIAFAVLYVGGGFRKTEPAATSPSPKTATNIADDGPSLGDPKASVTVVEFADFQCPFCGRFFEQTEPQIMDQYVKAGKVRFVYRNFAFLGQESQDAALAADCANEQGRFWDFHDYLFSHQNGENQGAFSVANLKQFAQTLKLDSAKFNACLDSKKYFSEIQKDMADAQALGVTATPSMFVNSTSVVGAVSFAEISKVIEQELAKKANGK